MQQQQREQQQQLCVSSSAPLRVVVVAVVSVVVVGNRIVRVTRQVLKVVFRHYCMFSTTTSMSREVELKTRPCKQHFSGSPFPHGTSQSCQLVPIHLFLPNCARAAHSQGLQSTGCLSPQCVNPLLPEEMFFFQPFRHFLANGYIISYIAYNAIMQSFQGLRSCTFGNHVSSFVPLPPKLPWASAPFPAASSAH